MPASLTRRDLTQQLALTALGLLLPGCSGGDAQPASASGSSGASGSSSGASGSSSGASGVSSSSSSSGGVTQGWARGGTAGMTDQANYPNPFTQLPATCALAVAMTAGPCTEAADRERRDITEGAPGLPVRLALRVLDANCKPLTGAKVKVWQTNVRGSYSGDTPNNAFCINDPDAGAKHYFRGVQTSGADGIVLFDTCFPGWYPGRAIHIHFSVTVNGRSSTSQVFFDQALIDQVFLEHVDYQPFGKPDTSNARDGVGGRGIAAMTVDTRRMNDGAMLAFKDVIVTG